MIFFCSCYESGDKIISKTSNEKKIDVFFYEINPELKKNKENIKSNEYFDFSSVATEEKSKKKSDVLMFGRVPFADVREMYNTHQPLLDYLSEKLGKKIELKFYPNYSKMIDGIIFGEIQIAWFGSVSYIGAIEKLKNTNLLCAPIAKVFRRNKSYLQCDIIARKDNNINSLKDLENKKIAFLDPKSTAGFILPLAMLENQNIKIAEVSDKNFLRHYGNIVKSVQLGKFDAGATFEDAYFTLLPKEEAEQIKIIAKSETVPFEPICVIGTEQYVNANASKLQNLLLNIDDKKILEKLGIQKFIEANANEYKALEKLIQKVRRKNEEIFE